jgi:hypothetical protein
MIPISFTLSRSTKPWLLVSLAALGLACGSAGEPPLGEREQPITTPEDSDAAANACDAGTAVQGPFGAECQVIAQGLCFTSAEEACACAGCATDVCAIAESFPAQAFCQNDDDDGDPDAPVSDGSVSSDPNGGGSGSSPGCSDPNLGCGEPGQTDPSPPSASLCAAGRAATPSSNESCDYRVGGYCFDTAEAACDCAGCDADACLVLESYPAQIACL